MVKIKIKPLRLAPVATVIASRIKTAIQNAKGDRWDRTGRLFSSVRMVEAADGDAAVAVAPDRLQDEHVRRMFTDECLPDQTTDSRVRNAIAKVAHDAIQVSTIKAKR